MLHITNGDSVIESFHQAGLTGEYLPWRDVLFEGPVAGRPLESLSDLRASALAGLGWGAYPDLRREFAARDAALNAFRCHDEVVLWFEHDLCDQLQLIQLLAWFADRDLRDTLLSLININSFPGVEPFHGLGQLTGAQLLSLLPTRRPVTAAQLQHASAAWKAFCDPSPTPLAALLSAHISPLPFLAPAVHRLLEEYPSLENGLSRAERHLLEAADSGERLRKRLYLASQQREEAVFMGDSSVWLRLDRLSHGPAPALETSGREYRITAHGRRLLACESDWIRSRGGVDLWHGGVHLSGPDAQWRWDRARGALAEQ